MNENLGKILVKRFRATEEDLANIRQWYYSHSISEREAFKEVMQALVEASKPFERSLLTIEVKYEWTAHSQDGETITIKASRRPKEILQAIDEWDSADADEQTP